MTKYSLYDRLDESQISPDDMAAIVRYDQATGQLIWMHRGPDCYENSVHQRRWNTFYAGQRVGSITAQGYVVVKLFGKNRFVHRVVWLLNRGIWPTGQIDHINGDKSDNRIDNLRDVSALANMRNRSLSRNNKSGFRGVYWNTKEVRWRAHIKDQTRNIHLGYFDDFEAAVEARLEAERRIGFHENHGRHLKLVGE